MNINHELPPIYDAIISAGMRPTSDAVYTYGDTIYVPSGQELPPELIEHESVHMRQQGDDPDAWWGRYLVDPWFRISQEIEAYATQYRHMCKRMKDRNRRAKYLVELAKILSGPTYGNIISGQSAMKAIKEKSNV